MTRLANEIRETGRPIYCSACFNSQPIRHIDFDAACDRGYGNDEAIKINLDDLVLCENCVREGARLLGMQDRDDMRLEDLQRKLDFAERKLRQAQRYADTMEDALANRPEPVKIDHRKLPRREIEMA